MMNRHFEPNRYERIEERQNDKQPNRYTSNQPQPKIFTLTLFNPKPRDKIWYYHVNPNHKLDLTKVAEKLAELFKQDLLVSENVFNRFDVYLTEAVLWRDVEKHTMVVLNELDGS